MTVDELRQGFLTPDPRARPMMRWWWFGPSIEPAELDRELTAMAAAGIGGVEVAFVYPLAPVVDGFGSSGFLEHVRYAAQRARELGLRFDLTLGSGWSYGGGHIGPDLAARQLHWDRREIGGSGFAVKDERAWPGDELVAAYLGAGALGEPRTYSELPIVDGTIQVPEGSGPREILVAYSRLTGQNVKRAAAGAEGPVLDHYSAAAVREHIRCVAEPLVAAATPELLGSVFCDSLEVYHANWTPAAFAEFARRYGYDLRPRLYQLVVDSNESAELRRDFHRMLSELYEENFLVVFREWAAGHGVPFRIQSYGEPPATVSSYRHADIFEGEGWGWQGLPESRWASSAAHLYGRDVVSAEVWTWVHSPSFRATPLDLKGEAHQHFLAGVNQLIGHGWPYSPPDAPGLGWFFYAAGCLDDRNTWWAAAPDLNRYLQRLSWLLRQGDHVADVRIYVPGSDSYASMGKDLSLYAVAKRRIGTHLPRLVREAGLDFDLLDDDATTVLAPEEAGVVIVPNVTDLPRTTYRWLEEVVAKGGTVIAVDSPAAPPSALRPSNLRKALPEPDTTVSAAGIGVTHRRLDAADIYFLANTTPREHSFRFTARTDRLSFEEWDSGSGEVRRAGRYDGGISLTLHPYEATVIVLSDADPVIVDPPAGEVERRLVEGPWSVSFGAGEEPVTVPHRWEDQPGRAAYSGSATYRAEFTIDGDPAGVHLDLGTTREGFVYGASPLPSNSFRAEVTPPVGVIAEIEVNGTPCGTLWAPPYVLDVGDHVRPGVNRLAIKVSNTAANALAEDQGIHEVVAESTRLYGQRFRMQYLDQAADSVASGLLSVPLLTLRRYRSGN